MKVLFVHQGRENIGVEYLSSVLKDAGHDVALAYDHDLFGLNDNVFYNPFLKKVLIEDNLVLKRIEEFAPDLTAFSVYTSTYKWARMIARKTKEMIPTKIVFGGIHATLVPEDVIGEYSIDFVIVGEGEYPLLELVESLNAGVQRKNIRNIWFRENDRIIQNEIRPPVSDLDSLPLPDKKIFEKYINYRDDYVALTSRGCCFNCSYCCESYNNKIYKHRYFRRRSPDSVMNELLIMKKEYFFRRVMFNDPVFFTDKEWLGTLLKRYRREIHVPFRCFGKTSLLDGEIARLLKKSGCYAIEFGVQTVNESIRKNILNRRESNAENERAFELCEKLGISYDVDHMFGLPEETEEDFIQGAEFYGKLKNLNRIKCHNLIYYPELEITRIARQKQIVTEEEFYQIRKGEGRGDFFHLDFKEESEKKKVNSSLKKFYKILPLLPESWVKWISQKRHYRIFRFSPSLLIILLQSVLAFKKRDHRFVVYLKYYPLRIRNILWKKLVKWEKSLHTAVVLFIVSLSFIPVGSVLRDYGIFHTLAILIFLVSCLFLAGHLFNKHTNGKKLGT